MGSHLPDIKDLYDLTSPSTGIKLLKVQGTHWESSDNVDFDKATWRIGVWGHRQIDDDSDIPTKQKLVN